MVKKNSKFSQEVRARAVRLVFDAKDSYGSQWAAMVSVAQKIGCTPETLRRWVHQTEKDDRMREGSTTDEKARIKQLEREVKELRRANEILRLASAYFAKAELDRPQKK